MQIDNFLIELLTKKLFLFDVWTMLLLELG